MRRAARASEGGGGGGGFQLSVQSKRVTRGRPTSIEYRVLYDQTVTNKRVTRGRERTDTIHAYTWAVVHWFTRSVEDIGGVEMLGKADE